MKKLNKYIGPASASFLCLALMGCDEDIYTTRTTYIANPPQAAIAPASPATGQYGPPPTAAPSTGHYGPPPAEPDTGHYGPPETSSNSVVMTPQASGGSYGAPQD